MPTDTTIAVKPITLALVKPSDVQPPKLRLSLNKGDTFSIEVYWNCHADHEDDVDIHGIECHNNGSGNGAKLLSQYGILSTHNTTKMNTKNGVLPVNTDGSFQTPSGGLWHSSDVRVQDATETIIVDGSKLADEINEIPLLATVFKADHMEEHEAEHDEDGEAAFADIEVCTITIRDADKNVLGIYQLSQEFGDFNVVQFGSIIRGENGLEYAPVGSGFNGDFNDVLRTFC